MHIRFRHCSQPGPQARIAFQDSAGTDREGRNCILGEYPGPIAGFGSFTTTPLRERALNPMRAPRSIPEMFDFCKAGSTKYDLASQLANRLGVLLGASGPAGLERRSRPCPCQTSYGLATRRRPCQHLLNVPREQRTIGE
jgi:hypothetical protein